MPTIELFFDDEGRVVPTNYKSHLLFCDLQTGEFGRYLTQDGEGIELVDWRVYRENQRLASLDTLVFVKNQYVPLFPFHGWGPSLLCYELTALSLKTSDMNVLYRAGDSPEDLTKLWEKVMRLYGQPNGEQATAADQDAQYAEANAVKRIDNGEPYGRRAKFVDFSPVFVK